MDKTTLHICGPRERKDWGCNPSDEKSTNWWYIRFNERGTVGNLLRSDRDSASECTTQGILQSLLWSVTQSTSALQISSVKPAVCTVTKDVLRTLGSNYNTT